LEREYGLDLITTAPNVAYQYLEPGGELRVIDNPAAFPEHKGTGTLEEPYVRATMFCPQSYVGPVMELAQGRRGEFKSMDYLDGIRVVLQYEIPLGEILYDFFDQLKSKTRGYASLDYEFSGYRESDLVKLNIMVHGEVVDALSAVVHRSRASYRARQLVEKLRELIPRQLFDIPVQAAIGGRIIARETIKALRKNVLAKCYGGDVTRKRKLLEKQREGKRRMKQVGRVEIPQEAFMAVLKTE
ncbi:MAG: elongation factor 4, partial [Firmicutes bacterium]|nr:elongation factor 4 [Bacillota bacterium]